MDEELERAKQILWRNGYVFFKDKRTVFGVRTGTYSDYKVECLFALEDDAREYADTPKMAENDGDVEEFTLYAAGERPKVLDWWQGSLILQLPLKPMTHWCREQQKHVYGEGEFGLYNRPDLEYRFLRTSRPMLEVNKWGDGFWMSVAGHDKDAVVKVLSDRKAMWLAGAWVPTKVGEVEDGNASS